MPCSVCQQPPDPNLANDFSWEQVRLCANCLGTKHRRNAGVSSLQLLLIWLPVCIYVPQVLNRTDLTGYWQSAHLIPAVLVAMYLSAFVYPGLLNTVRPNGLHHTGARWSRQLAKSVNADKSR